MPTPAAGNFNDGESAESWLERRDRVREKLRNGNGMGMPPSVAVQLLPTPRSTDANGAGRHGAGGLDLRTAVSEATDWGKYRDAIVRAAGMVGRAAPSPTEPGDAGKPRLSPRFVEFMMGLPDGWVDVAGVSRNAQLKMLGNGVVPQQAALALRTMLLPAWGMVL